MSKPLLVLGSANRKKAAELAELFAPLGLQLQTLADLPAARAVEENGETFAENAMFKATQQAAHLGCWVLADDSGLEVDALQGDPGVRSARYAGEGAGDAANNQLLLEKLRGVPLERRTARFVCHMALAGPPGTLQATSTGQCRGRILLQPRGTGGFGYDPLFEILEYHRSLAELGPVAKACLSHRATAARQIMPAIEALLLL